MGSYRSGKKGFGKGSSSSMSAEDFERICRTVDKAFSQVAKAAEKGAEKAPDLVQGISQVASSAAQRAQEAAGARRYSQVSENANAQSSASQGSVVSGSATQTPYQQTYQRAGRVWVAKPSGQLDVAKGRFRSSSGLTVAGVIMAALGGVGALVFGMLEFVGFVTGQLSDDVGIIAGVIIGIGLVGSLALLGFGIRKLLSASRLRAFQRAFGISEARTFKELAQHLGVSEAKALSWARGLLKRGLIPQGRIDDEDTTLMVTEEAYRQYCQFRLMQREQRAQQQAAEKASAAERAALQAHAQDLADRLTPAQRAFVAEGRGYQSQLRDLDARIDDVVVSERIVAIDGVVERILARAEEQPAVIAGIERLTAYYLPTTVKLLEAYDSLEDQPVQGENISNSRREIEGTLEVLRTAFEKLLDDTYHEMSIDVSTDISVLHSVLAREGLVESPFDVKP